MSVERWLGVELRHLASLSAVVREGSFRGAAARLGYAQSAVSQHVAELERAVGCRLVERGRGRRPIEMTAAGALLAARAERVLARVGATKAELVALDGGRGETVRLGVLARAAAMLPWLVEVSARVRAVRLDVHESLADGVLFERVRDGDLDMVVGEAPPPPGPFVGSELLSSEWVALTAREERGGGGVLSLAELGARPLIGARGSRAHAVAEEHLRGRRPDVRAVFRSESVDRVVALVEAGVGVALVPRVGVEHDRRVSVVRLEDPPPPFRLGLFWSAQTAMRPVAERLRHAIEREATTGSTSEPPHPPAPHPDLAV